MLSRMAETAKTRPVPAKKIAVKIGTQVGPRADRQAATGGGTKSSSKAGAETPTPPPTAARTKTRPEVRFRMRIRKGDVVALGPGKVELLEAVREHGSISAAARSLDMSYRRAWLLIDELNQSLKSPATISEQGGQSGGGCVLTPVGENIVRLYRGVEAQAEAACSKQIDELIRLIRA
jgi:molybdate transport system regulatory protein